jgi:AraC-like DNA-binding protein
MEKKHQTLTGSPILTDGAYVPYIHGGQANHKPASTHGRRRRLPCYALAGCLAGGFRIESDDWTIKLAAGDVVFLAPGVWRKRVIEQPATKVTSLNFDVLFQPERRLRTPARMCVSPPGWPADKPFVQPSPRDVWGLDIGVGPYSGLAERVNGVSRRWYALFSDPDPLAAYAARHELGGIILEIVRRNAKLGEQSLQHRIDHAESIALASLDARFGVAEFARAAGISRSHFATVYGRLRGRSPKEFLAEARLNHAKALLADGTSVKTTAAELGFSSDVAFTHFFKRRTGVPPTKWLHNHRASPFPFAPAPP